MTHALAEIGSNWILAAVMFGVLAAVGIVFVLLAFPSRIGPLHVLGSVVVVGLLGLGLWAAFGANSPASTTSASIAAGGDQFPPIGPGPGSGPSGQPSAQPSPGTPGPSPGGASCKPSGSTSITVTALVGASVKGFAETCLAVPAGKAFTVTFKNLDTALPHTWTLFKDPSATEQLGGSASAADFITGPDQATFQLKALPPGQYFYRCDIHPTVMTGTFVAG